MIRLLAWPFVVFVLCVLYVEHVTRPVADPSDDEDFDGRPARPGGGVSDGTVSAESASLAAPVSASHMAPGTLSGPQREVVSCVD